MFQINGKSYDCPYCHNEGSSPCQRGVEVGKSAPLSIELEGAKITADGSLAIQPGDTYIAKRNTGWKLLTCVSVDPRHWIQPKENAYCFDTWEAFKVLSIE